MEFNCPCCGTVFLLADGEDGPTTAFCSRCDIHFELELDVSKGNEQPPINSSVKQGRSPQTITIDDTELPLVKLPWYSDPILRWAVRLPAAIIGVFIGYLAWEKLHTDPRETIRSLRKEAAALTANFDHGAALNRYERIMKSIGNAGFDPNEAIDIESAAESERSRLVRIVERETQIADEERQAVAEREAASVQARMTVGTNVIAEEKVDEHEHPSSIITPALIGTDTYSRDVSKIKRAVLSDTIVPWSARFGDHFEVIRNKRGNKLYVGRYTSRGLNGKEGEDVSFAEVDDSGNLMNITIEPWSG